MLLTRISQLLIDLLLIMFLRHFGSMFFRFEVWVLVGRGYPRLAKGAGLKIRQSLVRDPVAQAFVGSSPTPRTTLNPPHYSLLEDTESVRSIADEDIFPRLKLLPSTYENACFSRRKRAPCTMWQVRPVPSSRNSIPCSWYVFFPVAGTYFPVAGIFFLVAGSFFPVARNGIPCSIG